MSEDKQTQAQPVNEDATQPHGDVDKPETDWKAEARKWEQRAKENKAAAKELEALKQSQMTEQQKAEERASRAEAELKQLKAEKQHAVDVRTVSDETGVPIALLECCGDLDAMQRLAAAYKAEKEQEKPVPAAPKARPTRQMHEQPATDTRDIFAQFMNDTFNKKG